jgi:hypothetical protein
MEPDRAGANAGREVIKRVANTASPASVRDRAFLCPARERSMELVVRLHGFPSSTMSARGRKLTAFPSRDGELAETCFGVDFAAV